MSDESFPLLQYLQEDTQAESSVVPEEELSEVEQALRWRMILGRFADEQLGFDALRQGADRPLDDLLSEARQMDTTLEYIYDREFAQRAHRQVGGSDVGGSSLSIPMWLGRIRNLFPKEAVEVMEQDALTRYQMHELVTDPETLQRLEPNEDLMKTILQCKHLMKDDVLGVAKNIVRDVVESLSEKLKSECLPALYGPVDPWARPPQRTFRNTDWRKTIRKNLSHYDKENSRLVVENIFFRHRQRQKSPWTIVVAVDQSGSMLDSLVHSAVMTAIFASLPSVKVHLILWDHTMVDMSAHVQDPLEILMSCQLGGGTLMYPPMKYCAELVQEPTRTIFVLLSDWYIGDEKKKCLALAHELREAGVTCIGLNALDSECRPMFDEQFAKELAGCGWFVATLTPKKLAEHIGKLIA